MTAGALQVEVWPFSGQRLLFLGLEGMPPDEAAQAAVTELDGGSVVVAPDLAVRDALVALGAREVRHVFAMRRDLAPVSAPEPPGLVLREWQEGDARLLAAAFVDAYHQEHPDAATGDLAEAAARLQVEVSDADNPVLRATTVAEHEGRPVGAAIVQRSEHLTGWKGPWVINVFRSPVSAIPGIGTAMLGRAIDVLRSDGESHVGLAVTATNPARRVYERLGFTYGFEGWVVVLPA